MLRIMHRVTKGILSYSSSPIAMRHSMNKLHILYLPHIYGKQLFCLLTECIHRYQQVRWHNKCDLMTCLQISLLERATKSYTLLTFSSWELVRTSGGICGGEDWRDTEPFRGTHSPLRKVTHIINNFQHCIALTLISLLPWRTDWKCLHVQQLQIRKNRRKPVVGRMQKTIYATHPSTKHETQTWLTCLQSYIHGFHETLVDSYYMHQSYQALELVERSHIRLYSDVTQMLLTSFSILHEILA